MFNIRLFPKARGEKFIIIWFTRVKYRVNGLLKFKLQVSYRVNNFTILNVLALTSYGQCFEQFSFVVSPFHKAAKGSVRLSGSCFWHAQMTLEWFSKWTGEEAHSDIRQKGKAYSEIRQKEVISARFPITKSELTRCCLRDEGPI